jgi:homoserine dehydrogenase
MRRQLIVLKLGGSVLTDRDALRRAVHEAYRWHRDGWRVVAVPSALGGVTDARLRAALDFSPRVAPHALATSLAIGELHSAAELGLAFDRAGVPATVLSPGAISLRGEGPPLDATPRSVDTDAIECALDQGVVIVPGFIAVGPTGETVTLGRGGSDLSALFLAHALGAERCRLVKDVDGLYGRDPALPGPPPDRYRAITWADALRLDGSIVQHKAIAFARDHGLAFEVGCFSGVDPTVVGPPVSRLESARRERTPLDIAVLGLGTVGGGVFDLLTELEEFRIVCASARNQERAREIVGSDVPIAPLLDAAGCGARIVIEAIGGVEPARAAIARALESGSHVVTANKAVLAAHGTELNALADQCGVRLIASASVGGSLPILERVRARGSVRPRSIRGVLNGTTNFVLDRVHAGETWERAIGEAQSLGLAEADPTRDLDGRDSADKLAVIAQELGASGVIAEAIPRDPLSPERIAIAHARGHIIRQIARLRINGADTRASVRVESVGPDDPLFDVCEEQNGVVIEWTGGSREVLRGRGAGRWPTAEAVIGDVLELAREIGSDQPSHTPSREEVLDGAT